MALIDISRTISPSTAVWPGDRSVEWTWTARIGEDDSAVNVGALSLSAHTGTHVDAPYHVRDGGPTTDELPLSAFIGPAQVVDARGAARIHPSHVTDIQTERVLFKTDASSLPSDTWPDSVTAIHPDTVARLTDHQIVLVGTDAPSVDPLDSTALPAHHALIEASIVNLEGLRLDEVSPGCYYLMAAPLHIENGDAAPVRAVLSDDNPAGPR